MIDDIYWAALEKTEREERKAFLNELFREALLASSELRGPLHPKSLGIAQKVIKRAGQGQRHERAGEILDEWSDWVKNRFGSDSREYRLVLKACQTLRAARTASDLNAVPAN